MAYHDYSPSVALDLLLTKVEDRSLELASSLRAAIDTGKDVWESETSVGARKPRKYRKAVRFSDEEALRVVISALQAYFVEQPLLTNSAVSEFADATLGGVTIMNGESPFDQQSSPIGADEPIETKLEIELQTETEVLPRGEETVQLFSTEKEMIKQQKENIERLSELTRFDLR